VPGTIAFIASLQRASAKWLVRQSRWNRAHAKVGIRIFPIRCQELSWSSADVFAVKLEIKERTHVAGIQLLKRDKLIPRAISAVRVAPALLQWRP
jgi:hypothetical protein